MEDEAEDEADFELENQAIARAALRELGAALPLVPVNPEPLLDSFSRVPTAADVCASAVFVEHALASTPRCRFERLRVGDVNVVMDVGHNPAALMRLFARLRSEFPDAAFRAVLGCSADKDMAAMCAILLQHCGSDERVHLVRARHPRAVPVRVLRKMLQGLAAAGGAESGVAAPSMFLSQADRLKGMGADASAGLEHAELSAKETVASQVIAAVEAAQLAADDNAAPDEVVVVCGTVFIMADARAALGVDEPRDSDELIAAAGAHLKGAVAVLAPKANDSA